MPHRIKCAHGRRYVEVLTMALVLMTLMSVLLLASSRNASAQTLPRADYRFQNTLKTSVGTAPALTKIGPKSNTFTTTNVDGTSRKVLSFLKGNGLKLSPTTGVVSSGTYTIVILFELDDVGSDVSRFRRIIDFKNGASDSGLYVEKPTGGGPSTLSFYKQGQGTVPRLNSTPIAANQYVQVDLTRDSGGTVVGYVDGVQQFTFSDAAGDAVIDANNPLRFFRDNQSGVEHSAGSVARIRLYDVALTEVQIGELDRLEPTTFTVNSNADLGDSSLVDGKCLTVNQNECTLRAAVQQSNHTLGNDTIYFAPSVSGTITPSGTQLSINNEPDSLTINGPKPRPGARILTVSANNASRVFSVADDAEAVINRLRIINGNSATAGGGIFNDGDFLTLINSTVSGNTSDGSAGILNVGGTMTITNSTVSGNIAAFNGGGIFNSGVSSDLTLINSTVTNNTAGQGGGGINNGGTAILRNTIVADNSASTGPDAFGSFSSQGHNLVGNNSGAAGFGGTDVLNKDPRLGLLQDNGGSTDTHALLSRSPAIDKGTNAGCPRTDQRGKARPMDGDGKGKAVCDIGSFEK